MKLACPGLLRDFHNLGTGLVSQHDQLSRSMSYRTLEAALSMRLQEYAENRSITNVIPLDTDHSCADFLLDMSPEQAEATELCALALLGLCP